MALHAHFQAQHLAGGLRCILSALLPVSCKRSAQGGVFPCVIAALLKSFFLPAKFNCSASFVRKVFSLGVHPGWTHPFQSFK